MYNARSWFLSALFITFFILGTPSGLAFQANDRAVKGLAGVFGYLSGQETSLKRIEEQFPEHKIGVMLARGEFNASYPNAYEKTRAQIIKLLGETTALQLLDNIERAIERDLPNVASSDAAAAFLKTVVNRANGQIEREGVKQFLHAIAFFDRPENEIQGKGSKRFSTTGEPKAKGLEISVSIPVSWEEKQGTTLNTVRGWTSEGGTGLSYIALLVRPSGDKRSKEDIQRAISSKNYTEILPKGAILRKVQPTQTSNRHGWYLEYEMTTSRVDLEITQMYKGISILHDGKTVELGCSTGGLSSDREKIINESERLAALCRFVLNSLSIDSVWRNQ